MVSIGNASNKQIVYLVGGALFGGGCAALALKVLGKQPLSLSWLSLGGVGGALVGRAIAPVDTKPGKEPDSATSASSAAEPPISKPKIDVNQLMSDHEAKTIGIAIEHQGRSLIWGMPNGRLICLEEVDWRYKSAGISNSEACKILRFHWPEIIDGLSDDELRGFIESADWDRWNAVGDESLLKILDRIEEPAIGSDIALRLFDHRPLPVGRKLLERGVLTALQAVDSRRYSFKTDDPERTQLALESLEGELNIPLLLNCICRCPPEGVEWVIDRARPEDISDEWALVLTSRWTGKGTGIVERVLSLRPDAAKLIEGKDLLLQRAARNGHPAEAKALLQSMGEVDSPVARLIKDECTAADLESKNQFLLFAAIRMGAHEAIAQLRPEQRTLYRSSRSTPLADNMMPEEIEAALHHTLGQIRIARTGDVDQNRYERVEADFGLIHGALEMVKWAERYPEFYVPPILLAVKEGVEELHFGVDGRQFSLNPDQVEVWRERVDVVEDGHFSLAQLKNLVDFTLDSGYQGQMLNTENRRPRLTDKGVVVVDPRPADFDVCQPRTGEVECHIAMAAYDHGDGQYRDEVGARMKALKRPERLKELPPLEQLTDASSRRQFTISVDRLLSS